jgi:cytochrome b pre-mRNA-processing protein 3
MFMYLLSKKARDSRESAKVLYEQIVTQARNPVFYAAYNIPDTPEGRFEMITMHCGLLVNRLCQSSDTKSAKLLAQALFDVMFADIELAIRELGVGDLAVPRRIKKMMSEFKGRSYAYDEAAKQGVPSMIHALSRNAYAKQDDKPSHDVVSEFAQYVCDTAQILRAQTVDDLMKGRIIFPHLKNYESSAYVSQAA